MPVVSPALSLRLAGGLLAAADPFPHVDVQSNGSALPGTELLQRLAGGIGFWALIAAIVGIFVGGVLWAFGSYSQNYQQAYNGRRGVLVSGLAALLVGAGPYLVHFLFSQGGTAGQVGQ